MNTRAQVVGTLKEGLSNPQLSLGRNNTFIELICDAVDSECQVSPRVALQRLIELLEYTNEDMVLDSDNGICVSIAMTRACILNNMPASRERSLALTKLDECELWAEKGCKQLKQ